MKLGHWPKCQKLHTYSLSRPPPPGGGVSKLSLFSLYEQRFPTYEPIFKLPYFGMKLGHWPKYQKLHISSLSSLGGLNWAYIRSIGSGLWDTGQFSKLPYLGMKLGHWPKFQKLHITPFHYQSIMSLIVYVLDEALQVRRHTQDRQHCVGPFRHIWEDQIQIKFKFSQNGNTRGCILQNIIAYSVCGGIVYY